MVLASTQTPSLRPASLRVMVVNDNMSTGNAVAKFFAWQGHDARAFGSGQEAIKVAPQFSPELVLVDLATRDYPGTEIGRRMRDTQNAHAPLIAGVSASKSSYLRRRCAEVGFDYFMTKPVSTHQYAYLLSAADKKRHVGATFFDRKQEYDAAFHAFVLAQLAFGELILDFAGTRSDAPTMQRSFERADRIGNMAATWVGRGRNLSADQVTRVLILTGALRRRLAAMRKDAGV